MTTFWIIAAGFTLIALAFVIPPLLRKNTTFTENDSALQANLGIYKERLAELQQENLSSEQFAAAKLELDKLLAQDMKETESNQAQPRARWVGILVIILLPALAVGGYFKYGSPQFIDPVAQESPHANAHGQMPKDFESMVAKLEQRLKEKPDDMQGWQMLGKSYAMLENYAKAVQAYQQVLALGGDKDAQVLADAAEMNALANEGQLAGQPSVLVKTALQIDPNNEKALWLSGVAAIQQGEYGQAVQTWERLLSIFPADETESRKVIEQQIAEARVLMKKSGQIVDFATPSTTTAETLAQPPAVVEHAKITVQVSLDPALQDKVRPGDTLFIYAKATSGMQMPLAIVRKMATELPITVVLDDSTAMSPQMKLSKFKQVGVFARISSSGTAMPQSGDLQGSVTPVDVATSDTIIIQINQQLP
jgi:cytochrome c-type biogenesis protein CcmH